MSDEKLMELAKMISRKTKAGLLNWEPDSNNNTYFVKIGTGGVAIYKCVSESVLRPFDPFASLTFMNERGETIGIINSIETSDLKARLLESIFENAEKSYLKSDSTFQSMFEELEK